jgi:hypothetical protein
VNDQPVHPDPNVRIPQQVQDAAARANEIAASLKSPPPHRPSGTSITNVSDISEGPPQDPGWEHKFNSMKGRFEAESARARQQSQQISELQRLLAMSSGPPTAPPAPTYTPPYTPPQGVGPSNDMRFGAGQPVTPPKLLSDAERQEYGNELLDVMGRRTMEIVGPEIARLTNVVTQLMQENAQLKNAVGGVRNVVTQDATGRFYDTLDKELPDWEQTNHDPEFVRWLENVDPFSGRVRKDLLGEAHRNNEASRVLNIIKGYRQEVAAVNPAGNLQPTMGSVSPPNGSGRPSPQFELQSLAAPGRAKSGQPPTPPDQPYFTRADITKFYADVTKGLYTGRDADKTALEAQLFQAAKEGRIR